MTEAVTLNQARLHLGVGKEKLKRLLAEAGIEPIQINRQRKEISLEQLEQLQQLLNDSSAPSGLDSGQPVNPTSQSNRSTGQPVNWSTGQLVNRSTGQPANRPTGQPVNRSTSQPVNRSTSQPVKRSTGQWINRLPVTGQPVKRSTDQPVAGHRVQEPHHTREAHSQGQMKHRCLISALS